MIIMASASGTLVPAIARLVAADEDTVRDVIHTFNAKGLAALDPQWAGGRPRLISDGDIEVIVTAARTRPEKPVQPFTHWSLRKLAGYLAGLGRSGCGSSFRLRATYHRTHGIRYFHGCYCAGDDQLRGITREHKGADHTLAALKSIRAARPDGYRLFVIMDNLVANTTPAIRRWTRRENAGLCFTPANASWANPIEAQSGPVRTFAMGSSDHRNHPALARKLQACLRWRNAHARHPGVLAAQRRERARLRSERQQRRGRPKPKAA
jgi:hypothetical protein